MLKKFFIIINPVSGRGNSVRKLRFVKSKLVSSGIEYSVFETRPDLHPDKIVRQHFIPGEYTDIMIIGGDGTINETVNGLDGREVPVSIISSGTGNDIARSWLGTTSLKSQLDIALNGKVHKIDTAICNGKIIINGIGVGFDGKVVESMSKKKKLFGGYLAYYYNVILLLAGFKESLLSITVDSKKLERSVFLITIAKGRSFGGGFLINPDARIDDGWLDVCIINKIPVYKRFLYLPRMRSGGHKLLNEVEFYKCRECFIDASSEMVSHADGEFFGPPPLKVKIQPYSLLIRKF